MEDRNLAPINMILQRHGNHAAVSGYDRICDYIPARQFKRGESANLLLRAVAWMLKPLYTRSGSLWYGKAGLCTELLAAGQWLKQSGQIFHFVYGENSYRYIGKLKLLRRNYIICTYHTPPQRFAEVVKDRRHLLDVDAVILVSRASLGVFENLLGPEKVHFIPHGVDTEFFKPADKPEPAEGIFTCLFVGSHLRDFEVLAEVARTFDRDNSGIRFEVITLKRDFHYFDGLGNVGLRCGISDDELRAAYQQADLFLMPLLDATANNSVLEAMACGLPMVVTDLPGVRDYLDESCARMVPLGDAETFAQAVLNLRQDTFQRARLGKRAREQSLQFSFERVAALTQGLYAKVAEPALGPRER